MAQLALFQGAHLPRVAAREALVRGDLAEAHRQLGRVSGGTDEAVETARLGRIIEGLGDPADRSVGTVHEAFAQALSEVPRGGFLTDGEWFAVYARHLATALMAHEDAPDRRFRGWLGAHFSYAVGEGEWTRRALRRILEGVGPGPSWIAAARIGFALGEAEAGQWIRSACLDCPVECVETPPELEPCGVPTLDAARPIPALPAPIEDLFETARALEDLPGPWTRWVAVVGEIDGVLRSPASAPAPDTDTDAEADRPASEASQASPTADPSEPSGGEDVVRDFLAALRAAQRSRARDRSRDAGRCSDRELRARRRMQRIAPELLARYVSGLARAGR